MKRELLETKLRIQSGMKRLEDLRGVHPDFGRSISAVIEMEFEPAMRHIDYLISVQP